MACTGEGMYDKAVMSSALYFTVKSELDFGTTQVSDSGIRRSEVQSQSVTFLRLDIMFEDA